MELAFRAAHTLKGVCMNLGFDHLYKLSFEITESLRTGNLELESLRRFYFFVRKCKIISFSSCKFSENEYNDLHKRRREEVQK